MEKIYNNLKLQEEFVKCKTNPILFRQRSSLRKTGFSWTRTTGVSGKAREYEESGGGKPGAAISKLDWPNHEFLSIGNLPNGTTSLVSRFLAQDAPDRNVIFRCREVSLLHPRSGDNIDPALH